MMTKKEQREKIVTIDTDPDQVALDDEEFDNIEEDFENITMEEEEKLKATESPLSKVSSNFVTYTTLDFVLVALYNKQDCIDTPKAEEVSAVRNGQVLYEKIKCRQVAVPGSGQGCSYTL